jgi:peptidoglycan/LPS O-acetylase OafA/YrhL
VGLCGFLYPYVRTGEGHPTALIPAAIGALILVCGAVASRNDALRKHMMHVAVVIGLLGFIATAVRLVMKATELNLAVLSQLATSIVCLVFVILAVRSFIDARRERD